MTEGQCQATSPRSLGLQSAGGARNSCLALSTAEAEYMALASAAQEAIWIQQLLGELNK